MKLFVAIMVLASSSLLAGPAPATEFQQQLSINLQKSQLQEAQKQTAAINAASDEVDGAARDRQFDAMMLRSSMADLRPDSLEKINADSDMKKQISALAFQLQQAQFELKLANESRKWEGDDRSVVKREVITEPQLPAQTRIISAWLKSEAGRKAVPAASDDLYRDALVETDAKSRILLDKAANAGVDLSLMESIIKSSTSVLDPGPPSGAFPFSLELLNIQPANQVRLMRAITAAKPVGP